jgi:flagellar hook assembly protein FlgD
MSDASTIGFSTSVFSRVRVSVLDVSGHRVRVLFDGSMEAGAHDIEFDARNAGGARLPAGLYFVSVEDGRERETRRIVVY